MRANSPKGHWLVLATLLAALGARLDLARMARAAAATPASLGSAVRSSGRQASAGDHEQQGFVRLDQAALAASEASELLRILDTGVLPGLDASGEPLPLTPELRAVVLESLVERGRSSLLPSLRARIEGASSGQRALALELLAEVGDARDLKLALSIACGARGEEAPSAAVRSQVEQVFTSILERTDEQGYAGVRPALRSAPESLLAPVVRAVVRANDAEGLAALSTCLHFDPELDRLLVMAIGQMAGELSTSIALEVRACVQPFLDSADEGLVAEAALAAGRLRDFGSIEALIGLLEHEHATVRRNAIWALRGISGLAFPERRDCWAAWLRAEQEWARSSAPRLYEQLAELDTPKLAAAINELGNHPAQKHASSTAIARCLRHPDPEARSLACLALGRLGDPTAARALVECLDDPDETVGQAAWRALQTLTGERLPMTTEAWRTSLSL